MKKAQLLKFKYVFKKIKKYIVRFGLKILLLNIIAKFYNSELKIIRLFFKEKKVEYKSKNPILQEIISNSKIKSVINDHIIVLFLECIKIKPKIIVELGVGPGESNFVFERVSKLNNADLISLDIIDCSNVSKYEKWHFVKMDDIVFSKKFKDWCKKKNLSSNIDVLFIDTSHNYEHTVQEIENWFKFLSRTSIVIFHDTNMKRIFVRNDKSIGIGWDNKRGVIRAIEQFFNETFNEKKNFQLKKNNWLIKHYSYCNGLTILKKL